MPKKKKKDDGEIKMTKRQRVALAIEQSVTEKRALDHVNNVYNIARQGDRMTREIWWREYYNIYRAFVDNRNYISTIGSNLYDPILFEAVETIVPRIVSALFGSTPFFDVSPREKTDIVHARVVKQLLQYQLDEMNFYTKFVDFIKQAAIYGTAIAKTPWRKEVRKMKVKRKNLEDDVNEAGIKIGTRTTLETVQEDVTIYDNPDFYVVDLFDFYIDPDATTIDDASWVLEKKVVDWGHLKRLQDMGIYKGIDSVKGDEQDKDTSSEQRYRNTAKGEYGNTKPVHKTYNLYEYWGLFDINNDGVDEECVITVVNNKKVVRLKTNPFYHQKKPYLSTQYIPLPNEFYGIGVIEPAKYIQYELNDKHNQNMDGVSLTLNNMWLQDRNAGINKSQLVTKQGGVIDTDDMKGLEALRPPDHFRLGFETIQMLRDTTRQVTGATLSLMGQPLGSRTTATEYEGTIQESNARLVMAIKLLEKNVLTEFLKRIYQLDQQFMTRSRTVRILGDEEGQQFVRILPEDVVDVEVDIIVSGASEMTNKQVKAQNLVNFLNIAGKIGPESGYKVNLGKIIRKIYMTFGEKDVEDIVQEVQQLPQAPQQVGKPPIPRGAQSALTPHSRQRQASNIADIRRQAGGIAGGGVR